MNKRSAFITPYIALTAACSLVLLAGCGNDKFESNKDFVEAIHAEGPGNPSGEDDTASVPPINKSMDDIAKIRMETTDLMLEMIKNNEIHHHKLKVYNDGKMPLKITKIDTTCACTMGYVTPETAVVPPMGESWIDVTLDPNRVPGFSSHKVLTITSTDPAHPQVEVQVRSTIQPEFYIEAEDLVVGDIPKGELIEKRLRVRQLQDIPMTVSGIEVMTRGATSAKIPGITARVEDIPEAQWQAPGKREYDVVVATTPELPAGAFERSMVLATDVGRLPKFLIRMSGTTIAPYAVKPIYPERIVLAAAQLEGDQTARANFIATAPLSLTIVSTSNPVLTATVLPGSSPQEAFVEARVAAADVPKKLLDETVTVQVVVEGKTFTEIVGVKNAGNADAAGGGHDH